MVVTLRSDFEVRAWDESLKDIWAAARYQVPPFSGDDLRQVILGPAQIKAVYFDPPKVADDLFDEVVQNTGRVAVALVRPGRAVPGGAATAPGGAPEEAPRRALCPTGR